VDKLSAPMPMGRETGAVSEGPAKVRGQRVSAILRSALHGRSYRGFVEVQVSGGAAYLFWAHGPAELSKQFEALSAGILASLRLTQPRAPSVTPQANMATPARSYWFDKLAGQRLRYLSTSTNNTVEKGISLCDGGRAVWRFSSSFNIGLASGAENKGDVGTWSIVDGLLSINWNQRGHESFRLADRDGGGTLLNGTRWYVVPQTDCN
jgi:hypothetical protein